MLNNLDWLAAGKDFPPASERERLKRYRQNKQIYDNDHADVYAEQLKRIDKVVGNVSEIISYPIVLNFQKKVSLKTADFLFLEKPIIKSKDEKQQETIDEIITKSDLLSIGFQGAIDCSRYGTAVYKIDIEDGKGVVTISSPEYLFIVVDNDNRKKITHYVIAWTYKEKVNGEEKAFLKATIYGKNAYRTIVFSLKEASSEAAYTIGKSVKDTKDVATGLDDFAVIPIHNQLTSDSVYGSDDYMDVDSIVSELEVRTAQISKILDVFASPTVSGSAHALDSDGKGGYVFNAGNFYARNDTDEPQLEYIVWEASLDANFKQVEKLINYLSVISEMGAAIFRDDMSTGNIPSGTALRKLYINVLAKVARVRNSFDKGFKKAIAAASQAGYGGKIEEQVISITWQDGLPSDPKEEAEIMVSRTGNKATMSVGRALKQYDGLTDDDIEKEQEALAEESVTENPMQVPGINNGSIEGEEGEIIQPEGDVDAELSYNGAQIQSALDIAVKVAEGTIASEAAISMMIKFLRMDEKTAKQIINAQAKVNIPEDKKIE